jgi:hypothetical protein
MRRNVSATTASKSTPPTLARMIISRRDLAEESAGPPGVAGTGTVGVVMVLLR